MIKKLICSRYTTRKALTSRKLVAGECNHYIKPQKMPPVASATGADARAILCALLLFMPCVLIAADNSLNERIDAATDRLNRLDRSPSKVINKTVAKDKSKIGSQDHGTPARGKKGCQ